MRKGLAQSASKWYGRSVVPSGLFGFERLKVGGLFFQLSELTLHPALQRAVGELHPALQRAVGELLPFSREVVGEAAPTCWMMDSDYLPSIVPFHKFLHALERLVSETYDMLSWRHENLNDFSEEPFSTVPEGLFRDPFCCRRPFAKHCFRPK